jgi:hypothetical protein
METSRPRVVYGAGKEDKTLVSIKRENLSKLFHFYHPIVAHSLFPRVQTLISMSDALRNFYRDELILHHENLNTIMQSFSSIITEHIWNDENMSHNTCN